MAKGYWIANVIVHDTEAYKEYQKANAVPFEKYGARFLVRGGEQVSPEGQSYPRSVVLEFPSYEAALACYESPEYTAARALRMDIAESNLTIVKGYDG